MPIMFELTNKRFNGRFVYRVLEKRRYTDEQKTLTDDKQDNEWSDRGFHIVGHDQQDYILLVETESA